MSTAEPPVSQRSHGPAFLALVDEARTRVRTFSIEEFIERLQRGERFVLLDNREDHEWQGGHLPGAHHMSKGVLEREIEAALPDRDTPIVCYCGRGYRSVLACDSLQRMGYANVVSLDGGWHGWLERGMPTVIPEPPR